MAQLLIVPPPKVGGGPSNAILRCVDAMSDLGVTVTPNIFSNWNAALVNVGLGIRLDLLKIVRRRRRIVYRADGYYVKEIFEHEGNPWNLKYDHINTRIKRALRTFDFVIYQSQFSKRYLDQLYVRPKGTWDIIYNSVNTNLFSPGYRTHHDPPVVGCIGNFRLNRIKTITDICKKLPFKHRLLLVGRMDEQCKYDLQNFQRNNKCTIVEHIPQVYGDIELIKWHKEIDCFLHPFLSDWCPNAVVEALSCGTPVVTLKYTGGGEVTGNGGVLMETERWINYSAFLDEAVNAVIKIIDHWSEYSFHARQRAESMLDVEIMAKKYFSAIFPTY